MFGRWKIHDQLFGSGPDNVDLLNASGSNVFHLLQALFIENVFLTLSRLTDKGQQGAFENISLPSLVEKASRGLTEERRDDLGNRMNALSRAVKNVRTHRNKRIAHRDAATAMSEKALPSVSYGEVDYALQLTRELMGELWLHLRNASTDYDPHVPYGSDGTKLLAVLRRGDPTYWRGS